MAVVINEWLPNPASGGVPWIELYNRSASAVDISGWTLSVRRGGAAVLDGEVPAHGFLVVKTPLIFLKSRETLTLSDNLGAVRDTSSYAGRAPSGRSYARAGERFIFTSPTPGEANGSRPLYSEAAPAQPLPAVSRLEGVPLAVVSGIVIAVFVFAIVKLSNDLSHLFFTEHE